jgi:hypothetical protein
MLVVAMGVSDYRNIVFQDSFWRVTSVATGAHIVVFGLFFDATSCNDEGSWCGQFAAPIAARTNAETFASACSDKQCVDKKEKPGKAGLVDEYR